MVLVRNESGDLSTARELYADEPEPKVLSALLFVGPAV